MTEDEIETYAKSALMSRIRPLINKALRNKWGLNLETYCKEGKTLVVGAELSGAKIMRGCSASYIVERAVDSEGEIDEIIAEIKQRMTVLMREIELPWIIASSTVNAFRRVCFGDRV